MPPTLRIALGALILLAGAALLAVAVLGARSRLRRNRWLGVRTVPTLVSDTAWDAAHHVAAVPLGAGGAVAAVAGAALLAGAGGTLGWVVLCVGLAGFVVLTGVGGLAGDRAARAAAPEPATSPGCAGACAGCDLVAGCRDAIESGAATSPRSPNRP